MSAIQLSTKQRGLFFVSLLFAYFAAMFALSGSSIFISAALTGMGSISLLELAFTLETLFRCIMIPLSAKLGERYLRRNLFLLGLVVFVAGAVLCAAAWSPLIIVVARSLMGLAWGLFFSNIVVMLSDVYQSDKAPKMNGFLQAFGFVASLIAAPVAGLFVDFLTWQWALYMTIPFAVLAVILMIFVPNVQEKVKDGKKLDIPGVLVMALVLIPFSLALSWGGTSYEWTSPVILILLAASVVFLIVLIVVEKKAQDPVFPVRLFRNKNYIMIFFIGVFFSAVFASLLFLPAIMQAGLGFSATESSLPVFATSLVCIVFTSFIGARFAKTQKAKTFVLLESIVTIAVGIVLLFVAPGFSLIILVAAFAVLGFAQAVHQIISYSYPSVAMKPSDIAVGVAFIMFGQSLAMTIFNAVLGALMNVNVFLPIKLVIGFGILMLVCVFIFKDKKAEE